LGRGGRGGLGLGGGQVLGLVWQEDSSCAVRVPRSGSGRVHGSHPPPADGPGSGVRTVHPRDAGDGCRGGGPPGDAGGSPPRWGGGLPRSGHARSGDRPVRQRQTNSDAPLTLMPFSASTLPHGTFLILPEAPQPALYHFVLPFTKPFTLMQGLPRSAFRS